jgi:hypothetical protein
MVPHENMIEVKLRDVKGSPEVDVRRKIEDVSALPFLISYVLYLMSRPSRS